MSRQDDHRASHDVPRAVTPRVCIPQGLASRTDHDLGQKWLANARSLLLPNFRPVEDGETPHLWTAEPQKTKEYLNIIVRKSSSREGTYGSQTARLLSEAGVSIADTVASRFAFVFKRVFCIEAMAFGERLGGGQTDTHLAQRP